MSLIQVVMSEIPEVHSGCTLKWRFLRVLRICTTLCNLVVLVVDASLGYENKTY